MPATAPRSDDTRERLLAAGLELFGHYGYEGVTTRMLAAAAKVNQHAIPYHFGGKEGVYLAVTERLCSTVRARLAPVLARIREALAAQEEGEGAAAVPALLLELTLALGRIVFDPEHRSAWFTFLTREQFHPTAAFDLLYRDFTAPAHALVGELVGRLTGQAPEAPETILLTHAYLGQIVAFAAARATLNRRLGGEGDYTPEQVAAILKALERFSRAAIAGLAG